MHDRTCVRCGWRFTPNTLATDDYCSPACTNAAMRTPTRTPCVVCGGVVHTPRRTICSDECTTVRLSEQTREGARRARRERRPSVLNARRKHRLKKQQWLATAKVEHYNPLDIADRDRWRCSICGGKISRTLKHPHPKSLAIDHVIPISMGGDDVPANVAATHHLCNARKGNRTVPSGEQLRLIG